MSIKRKTCAIIDGPFEVHSLEVLRKKVLKENLEWIETDKEIAYKNMKLDARKFNKL